MAHVPRLYLPHATPGRTVLDGDQSRRLGAVMRLREGDTFLVFGGDGREWRARVEGSVRGSVHATIEELVRQEPPPLLTVEVWCGMVRANRFDWAVEKCTEAGADIIRPLVTEHAARGEDASAARLERWGRLAVEASEQCGRLYLPVVEAPGHFDRLLDHLRTPLVIGARGGMPWQEAVPLLPARGRVIAAIGPEGGFSEAEVARAKAAGALTVAFGPHILRAETAAVVAVALLRSLQA
ncbi:MAG: 16S rRNA (uracil(1498)-N(3))-methyltransferase [Chloroflexi bacterium]|nr:16S rRNA (uracil(1498)-N(3))-methyltransferase [Chloroflexota bacterium]